MDFQNIEIIAQLIGFLAMGMGIIAYLSKTDKNLKLLMSFQNITLAAHFFLLGGHTAAAISLITSLRNALSLKKEIKKIWPVFVLFYIALGLWQYKAWWDIFPILAGICNTYAYFNCSGIRLRVLLLVGSLLWLTHNITITSLGPTLMEVFLSGSLILTIYKLKKE